MISSTAILITQRFSEASFIEQITLPRIFSLLYLKLIGLRAGVVNPYTMTVRFFNEKVLYLTNTVVLPRLGNQDYLYI